MEQVCVDLLTGLHEVQILLWAKSGPDRFSLPMQEIDRNVIPRLVAHGLHLEDTRENAELLQSILLQSGQLASIMFTHGALGFKELDSELMFLAQHPIGCSNQLKARSLYIGDIAMETAGSLDGYIGLLQKEVVGHTPLELALAISFTPLALFFLRRSGYLSDLPIFAFVGPSSTGKTLALRLIASVYGSPAERDGLIGDFNSTDFAIPARFAGLVGMPLILDEATDANYDFKRNALTLSKGCDRNRCNPDGSLKRATRFVGSIIVTSEKSVLTDELNVSGASARVVEFRLPSWTDDADHAMRLERKLIAEHGTAVVPFVETALRYSGMFPNFFEHELRLLREAKFADNAVEGRKLKALALVLTAATFVRVALGIKLDKERLRKLLVEQHQLHQPEPESRDRVGLLYDATLAYLTTNQYRMKSSKKDPLSECGSVLGEFCEKAGRRCAWIVREEYDKFLKQQGYMNTTEALQVLHNRGWLYRSSDRHYAFTHQLVRVSPKCYCLFLPEPKEDDSDFLLCT